MLRQIGKQSQVPSTSEVARPTEPVAGKRTRVEELPTVQCSADGPVAAADVHAAAASGVATPSSPLPHAETIQRLFGRHDVSSVQAHTGTESAASADAIGARAYATGNHVVLGQASDLHTVAHEAAHVVQQRGGVSLFGGVGGHDDPYERQADAVANRVVAGKSAEDLFDANAGASASRGDAAVQLSGKGEGKRKATAVEHDDTAGNHGSTQATTSATEPTRDKRSRLSRLQIADATSGSRLEGAIPNLAGQQVRLKVSTVDGQLTEPRWTLPQGTVGNYALSRDQAQTTPVQDTNTPEIAFYFIAAGRQTVTIAGLVDGTPDSTDIVFNVTKPAFELSARQGQTAIKQHDGIPKFQLVGFTSGITVTGRVTTKAGEAGILTIVQLINANVRHIAELNEIEGGAMYDEPGRTKPTEPQLALQANHTHIQEICTTNGWVLDTKYPYERKPVAENKTETITAKDSPKYPIYPSITKIDFQEKFQVYLMYQPRGGIPTTLGRLDWQHEAGVHDPNAPSPTWYQQVPNAKLQLEGQATDDLPTWNANAEDLLNTEFQRFTSDPHG